MTEKQAFERGEELAGKWIAFGRIPAGSIAREGQSALEAVLRLCDCLEREEPLSSSAELLLGLRWQLKREGNAAVERLKRCRRSLPAVSWEGRCARLLLLGEELSGEPACQSGSTFSAFLRGVQAIWPMGETELELLPSALLVGALNRLKGCAENWPEGQALTECAAFLRMWTGMPWPRLLEELSVIHQNFSADEIYCRMPLSGRSRYRRRAARLARRAGEGEGAWSAALAERAAREGRHIGFLLYPPVKERKSRGSWYVLTICGLTAAASVFCGLLTGRVWISALAALPLSEIIRQLTDALALTCSSRRPVFRLDEEQGLPEEGKTLCVVPAVVTGEECAVELAAELERSYLANRRAGDFVSYGILADLPDGEEPADGEKNAALRRLREELWALNRRWGERFFLFTREQTKAPNEECWRGWERKRGALLELLALLSGEKTGLTVEVGDPARLAGTAFLITTDSDTRLGVDAVRRLAGAMLHPLNRPVVDAGTGRVVSGYGLLQPRMTTRLTEAEGSRFAALFCGGGGTDPYTAGAAELYHDLFDRGSYCGKGIMDVRAAWLCLKGRFPEDRVLSHDLLEGAYLRTGYFPEVELADGFPQTVESALRRSHRWTRGDWQAARWMFSPVPRQDGKRIPNPLPLLDRWKQLDNLRRSLLPAAETLCLLLWGLGLPEGALCLGIGLLALASPLWLAVLLRVCGGLRGALQRTFEPTQRGIGGAACRAGAELALLPLRSWNQLSAVCTALWRSLVTKRKRLEWTVGGEEEETISRWMPGLLTGTILLAAAPGMGGRLLGLVWFLSPLLPRWLNRSPVREEKLSEEERQWLLRQAQRIWRYFDDWLRPEDHYLPPDHLQEAPATGLARRTSPTNIGLALLAPLAATELGFLDREQAAERIARQLETVEGLEKYRGHLYNWYSTETAKPIPPAYISTVDSGNLCGDLIALKQGLLEWGETALAERAEKLAAEMRFGWLYDGERQLFRIGYDVSRGAFTESWYDLMASEARQTSYLAVARGEVPAEHWGRLSRELTRLGRRFGLMSWGGTAFEYGMPQLLVPAPRGSLLRESLLLCAAAQRRWGEKRGLPWGVSESAYFQVDAAGSYQYAAHGVSPLGLCPGLERERVIAPYASFLSLELAPGAAIRNLRRLETMGAAGKYGFYEAVDATPERTGGEPVVLRSWMAHHLGMSLLAVCNLLCASALRRRFLAEPEMAACEELLEEQLPLGLPLRRGSKTKTGGTMEQNKPLWRAGTGFDPERPLFHQLAADTLSCTVRTDGDFTLAREPLLLAERPELVFRTKDCLWRLFPAEGEGEALEWRFAADVCSSTLRRGPVKGEQRLRLEVNGLLLCWTAESEREGELELSLLPVLAERDAYEAHRAFARISLESREEAGSLLFRRRPSGGKQYPALAARFRGAGQLRAGENATLCLRVPIHPGRNEFCLALGWGTERDAIHSAEGLLLGAGCLCPPLPPLTEEEAWREDSLLSALLSPEESAERPAGQSALWAYGISGDLPIWALPCTPDTGIRPEEAVTLWASLRRKQFRFDLALLTPDTGRDKLREMISMLGQADALGEKGGIHLPEDEPEVRRVLRGMAALWGAPPEVCRQAQGKAPEPEQIHAAQPLRFWWEGEEFRFRTGGGLPKRRWSQILTSGAFGWTADDCGTGHLWSGNAHENKLTPWRNDPYAQAGPERLFLEAEGKRVSLFAARDGIDTLVCYGPGYASWEKSWDGMQVKLIAFVPVGERRRIFLLTVSGFPANARLLWSLRLQMAAKEQDGRYVRIRQESGSVLAENPANTLFPGEVLRLSGSERLRLEQRGKGGVLLSAPVGSELVLSAGLEEASALTAEEARSRLEQTIAYWREQAGFLKVRTPELALNHYLSFWGRYQTIACRLMARTALYQCGGAYGFRDQLQDVCGLLPGGRELAREQILRCCRHQYEEGDVQHWWHCFGRGERGVRTRVSDDLLWLPWAISRWVRVTGDRTLLEEPCGYLTSPPLKRGERVRYEAAERSPVSEPVLRHGLRAVECCLGRGTGEHGLLLMGSGDWNDGMDGLGEKGRGESVWLTWFASLVLRDFAPLCTGLTRARYERISRSLAEKANGAWDGAWYRRAYDDEGRPVGSRESEGGCRMDSIAQSFSVFAPNPRRDRAELAVQSAFSRLYDPAADTVALLAPPFAPESGAGYIAAYPGGTRENGGQYTHAAVWLAMAFFRLGDAEQGWRLLRALLPENHPAEVYQGEPYVLAGDVSTARGTEGRCGWSWYTGAASWFCRAVQEELLGLRVREGALSVEPRLPESWPGYEAEWKLEGKNLRIRVTRGTRTEVTLNGEPTAFPLTLSALTVETELQVTVAKSTGGAKT